MTFSVNAVNLVKAAEGLRLRTYDDGTGVLTIGWGHTRGVKKNDVITKAIAETFLNSDLTIAEMDLNKYVKVVLNQNQYDALTSFVLNFGGPKLASSDLLKYLNAGKFIEAANELDKWIHGGGKEMPGLVIRRAKEKELFLTPIK